MRDASYLPSPKNTLSFIGAWKWKIGNASLGLRGTRGLHFFYSQSANLYVMAPQKRGLYPTILVDAAQCATPND